MPPTKVFVRTTRIAKAFPGKEDRRRRARENKNTARAIETGISKGVKAASLTDRFQKHTGAFSLSPARFFLSIHGCGFSASRCP